MARWGKTEREEVPEAAPVSPATVKKYFVVKEGLEPGQDKFGRLGFLVREDQLMEVK